MATSPTVVRPAERTAPDVPRSQRRPRRSWAFRPLLRRMHKWASLIVGVVLLAVVISGVVVLFAPELDQVTKPELYHSTPTAHPVSFETALGAVNRAHPDFDATLVVRNRGIYDVYDKDFLRHAAVDPGTGRVLGTRNPTHGVIGFFLNLHECLLSCEGYTAYVPFLAEHTGIPWGFDGEQLTIAGALLAITGLTLFFMAVSGLVLWWPGVKRFARGFVVRRGRGRYKRDYDLHKVAGFAALPFLLMWAITGTNFELRAVGDVWYGLTPGKAPVEAKPFESKAAKAKADIGSAAAERAALAVVPGGRVTSVAVPDPKDQKTYYDVWMSHGVDPSRTGEWPGTVELAVDRKDPAHTAIVYGDNHTLPQKIWENWTYTTHYGQYLGWLPRSLWLAFGLVPLLLAVTGISMVLIKRRKRRARKRWRAAAHAVE
jgi:uncharacterized iron-regulated membrane protein